MSVIEVNNVEKKFKVYFDKGQSLKEKLLFKNRNHYEERWVLKGISFEVGKGEAIGIIGENGCGKSTLLKLMTKIMYPDRGSISIQGRVSSLIELGAGFHPDMSGRENIYTNASIFGLSKKEIDKRLDNIIDFSELKEFIDNPVRTYSSGMYMRLAFSVAINVDADVLLIDEILAVGDANFQSKCFEKMREIKRNGTTIVIVSHSLGQIEQICERSYWINNGVVKISGRPQEVHGAYLSAMGEKRQNAKERSREKKVANEDTQNLDNDDLIGKNINNIGEINNDKNIDKRRIRFGSKKVEIIDAKILNMNGEEKNVFKTGESFQIRMDYISSERKLEALFGFAIYTDDDIRCYGTNTFIENSIYIATKKKGYAIACINNNNLLTGDYYLNVAVYSPDNFPLDDIQCAKYFSIVTDKADIGICRLSTKWKVDNCVLDKLED